MKVYLCGPINGCTDEEATSWRDDVKSNFPVVDDLSFRCIDPMKRDYRGVEETAYREIVDLDKRDVRAADVVLVNYVKPSVGTSMEIHYAWTIGKPVVLWCAPDTNLSPWLRYHSTSIVNNLTEAVQKIKEIAL